MIKKCNKCGKKYNAMTISRKYCSKACANEARFPGGAKKRTCEICGKVFDRNYSRGKKYCSQKCYHKDMDVRIKRALSLKTSIPCKCEYCGKDIEVFRNYHKESKLKRFFCDKTCFRSFLSERFNRNKKKEYSIKGIDNYDVFLSQEFLPCLIEGCKWEGKNLSTHMNFEHGITTETFKKMFGFNKRTAVISNDSLKKMIQKGIENKKAHNKDFGIKYKGNQADIDYEDIFSREERKKNYERYNLLKSKAKQDEM